MAGIEYIRPQSQRKLAETICDVHRDMYLLVKRSALSQEEKDTFLDRIEVAFKMGKSMSAKLRQYKNNYDDDWWEKEKRAWDWKELKG